MVAVGEEVVFQFWHIFSTEVGFLEENHMCFRAAHAG